MGVRLEGRQQSNASFRRGKPLCRKWRICAIDSLCVQRVEVHYSRTQCRTGPNERATQLFRKPDKKWGRSTNRDWADGVHAPLAVPHNCISAPSSLADDAAASAELPQRVHAMVLVEALSATAPLRLARGAVVLIKLSFVGL